MNVFPRASKQVLNVLKKGMKIEGADWALSGDLGTGYINQYTFGMYNGCWNLDMEGLKNAISDIRKEIEDAEDE